MTEKLSAFDLETFISKLVDALPKFVGAAIIIALGFWVSALIGKLLIKGLERKGVDASIHSFLRSIVVWVLRFAVILSALSTLGFNLNSFIAALCKTVSPNLPAAYRYSSTSLLKAATSLSSKT